MTLQLIREARHNMVKKILEENPVATITFQKLDGAERVMQVDQTKVVENLKGEEGVDWAVKASKTRAENNPQNLAVWDADAKDFRTINMERITEIDLGDGTVYSLELLTE